MSARRDTPGRVVVVYTAMNGLFTLAASLIWATNTVFLLRVGGLTLFEVMLVNAIFTLAQMVFEVPTGVVADTIGRRASMLLSMATLAVSTLLYVATPRFGWGITGFALASVVLGLGYTFQTGAVDAWLVDALDATGYDQSKERAFARGSMAAGAGMLVGSLAGGLLGQVDLALPYLVRAGLVVVCLVLAAVFVRDAGFERRPLHLSSFAAESRAILDAGARYGWRSKVVRPMLWVSAVGGLFYMFGFYAWQPYVLALLGDASAVWVLGVTQAAFSAVGMVGNALVGKVMTVRDARRAPARVLAGATLASAVVVGAIGALGIVGIAPGWGLAATAIGLWLVFGLVFGVAGPVRMAYLNEQIPSAQRATVLSLDAFFGDAGGTVGQPGLGRLSDVTSPSLAWIVGALFVAACAPLYAASGRAAAEK